MKKGIVVLLVITAGFAFAQRPETFGGAVFNHPMSVTVDALELEGIQVDVEAGGYLSYEYKIGGDTWAVYVQEIDDSVCLVAASRDADRLYAEYKELRGVLIERYGRPSMNIANFKWPYKEGDGDEDMAIQAGYAGVLAEWSMDNWRIRMMASKTKEIVLFYISDVERVDAKDKAEKDAEKAQF